MISLILSSFALNLPEIRRALGPTGKGIPVVHAHISPSEWDLERERATGEK